MMIYGFLIFYFIIKKIKYFDSNEKVTYNQNKFGLIIDLSNKNINPIDTIIEIEL